MRAGAPAAWSAAFILLAVAAAAAPVITATPRSPRVGEVVFLTFMPEREVLRASCSWGRASYQLLPNGSRFELVLPVSLTTRAGGHHATLYWKYADGTMGSQLVPVEVGARRFGIQRLKLSARQESSYSAPGTARERALIGAALELVSPERRWSGSFAMPVQGRISTEFGLQRYVNGKFDYRHRGVDVACPEGRAVRAAADGVVSLADDSFILHGQTVILDHGQGVSTLYLHMSAIEVRPGQSVQQGQVIGRVGATGVATGPHLHYAVYVHHEAVDPFFWNALPAI
jgi:murein DD-endopeptidase MepM/ murein hydrolase activator NlpD